MIPPRYFPHSPTRRLAAIGWLMILGVIVIGLVGFSLTWIGATLEARLLRWRSPKP